MQNKNEIKTYGWGWVPRWERLLADFVLLAEKLERLGLAYADGKVIQRPITINSKNERLIL